MSHKNWEKEVKQLALTAPKASLISYYINVLHSPCVIGHLMENLDLFSDSSLVMEGIRRKKGTVIIQYIAHLLRKLHNSKKNYQKM